RAVAGITGPMAMTVWVFTTTTCSGNTAGPHVAQLGDLQLHSGATAFQVHQKRVGHKASLKPSVSLRSVTCDKKRKLANRNVHVAHPLLNIRYTGLQAYSMMEGYERMKAG